MLTREDGKKMDKAREKMADALNFYQYVYRQVFRNDSEKLAQCDRLFKEAYSALMDIFMG